MKYFPSIKWLKKEKKIEWKVSHRGAENCRNSVLHNFAPVCSLFYSFLKHLLCTYSVPHPVLDDKRYNSEPNIVPCQSSQSRVSRRPRAKGSAPKGQVGSVVELVRIGFLHVSRHFKLTFRTYSLYCDPRMLADYSSVKCWEEANKN